MGAEDSSKTARLVRRHLFGAGTVSLADQIDPGGRRGRKADRMLQAGQTDELSVIRSEGSVDNAVEGVSCGVPKDMGGQCTAGSAPVLSQACLEPSLS